MQGKHFPMKVTHISDLTTDELCAELGHRMSRNKAAKIINVVADIFGVHPSQILAYDKQPTLKELRKATDCVQVVEHWCQFSRRRKDLFGFVDVLACAGSETIAVQTTSWNNVSARAKKMSESPYLDCLRRAGWKVLIHGWKKNDKTNRYELKVLDLS